MSALTDRTFGVEIECGGPRERIMNALRDKLGLNLYVHGDGSGNEIDSGVLKGERGIKQLKRIMDVIRDAGGWTSMSDGMHVHHGAWEFYQNHDLQVRLIRNWLNMENAIESIIAPYRRDDYGSCARQWNRYNAPTLATYTVPQSRGKLNLNNLHPSSNQGSNARTIEFRSHEGSLHSEYAAAWVRMTQALIERTVEVKRPFRTCSTVRGLATRLSLDVEVAELLKEKAANVKNPLTSTQMRELVTRERGPEFAVTRENLW